MKLTSRQKMLIGVLGLGATLLAMDQLFLGTSEAAAPEPARAGLPAASVASMGSGQAAALVTASSPRTVLAERFDRLARQEGGFDDMSVRDAFRPAASWLPQDRPVDVPLIQQSPAERFKTTHTLTGVMAGATAGHAIVDGRALLIGQRLEGFLLVAVGERSATFEADGKRVVLEVPETDR